MKVSLRSFQSWDKADLELEGFTTIVGPSNIGKSAIFRAIKGAMRNDIPSSYIKEGSKELLIDIKLENDEIEAKRTSKGSVTYTINGKEYGKLAGATPEALNSIGYSPIDIGSVELDPIFGGQFDTQFLLNATPGDLNIVLGAFASTEKLDRGKKSINVKIKENDSEIKILSGQIGDKEEVIHSLESVIKNTDPIEEKLIELSDEIANGRLTSSNLSSYIESLDRIEELRDVYKLDVVSLDGAKYQVSTYDDLYSYRRTCQQLRFLKGYKQELDSITESKESIDHYLGLFDALEIVSKHEVKIDTKSLVDRVELTLNLLNETKKNKSIVSNLDSYIECISEITVQEKAQGDLDSELLSIKKELKDLKKDLEEAIKADSLITCPKCGYKFKEECLGEDHE